MPAVSYDGNLDAVKLVMEGKILCTVFTNPHWGGGVSSALAYYAAIGTFKPSEEPNEHREFYGPTILIQQADAEKFKTDFLDNVPTYEWTDFWGPSNGGIVYKQIALGGPGNWPAHLIGVLGEVGRVKSDFTRKAYT